MKRWILLVVAIVGLSAAVPIIISNLPEEDPTTRIKFPVAETAKLNPGKALVEGERKHDFGKESTFSEGQKSFIVKNVGTGPLTLKSGTSSCFCTVANFTNKDGTANKDASLVLEPGESTPIQVSWKTKDKPGKFGQRVTVLTSDPSQPELDFSVTGEVFPPIVTMPEDMNFDFATIASTEESDTRLALGSFDTPEFKVLEIVSSNPDSVSATFQPLSDSEKAQLKYPGGHRVDIVVKPSSFLGEFAEELTIKTDHPKLAEMKAVVRGKRVGPISVAPERIRLNATSAKGGQLNLMVLVREQETTRFEVVQKPEGMEVKIDPMDDGNAEAKVRRYRLHVELPPGTPPGSTQNEQLVLKTNHPHAETLAIPVTLIVLGSE